MAVQSKAGNPSKKKASSNPTKAPAQYSQPSRKGKKAWRKNIDLVDIEDGMEQLRDEERVTGSTIHSKSNTELFQIDDKGDDKIRKSLPKVDFSKLSYAKLIAQRSAVPAVHSRANSNVVKKHKVKLEEKNRLLALAKRNRKGPLNSVLDPSELGNGSASLEPSHAVKESGKYDVWAEGSSSKDVQMDEEHKDILAPHLREQTIKKPAIPHPRSTIDLPAITEPHPGTSYKPSSKSRTELVKKAYEKAAEDEECQIAAIASKDELLAARKTVESEEQDGDIYLGMTIDKPEDNADLVEDGGDAPASTVLKPSVRKTKQQKQKAEKLKAEKRVLLERRAKKKSLTEAIQKNSKAFKRLQKAKEEARERRKAEQSEKLRTEGLSGHKIGKHRVPEEAIEVQLSDEVSDSLRAMKVEGNLFRDRFLSLQRRAVIEPRAPVVGKKRKLRVKEIEKHAYKRFA